MIPSTGGDWTVLLLPLPSPSYLRSVSGICSTVKSGESCGPSVPIAALRGQLSWVMQCVLSGIIPTPIQRLTWSNSDNWSTSLGNKWNKGGSKGRRLTFRLFLVGCDGTYEVLGSHVDLRIAVLTYDLQGGKVAENLVGSGVGSYPVLILHHLKIKFHTLRMGAMSQAGGSSSTLHESLGWSTVMVP